MVSSVFRDTIGMDISLPAATTATEQESAPYEIFIMDDGSISFGDAQGLSMEELEESLRVLIAREPEARMALTADGAAAFKDAVSVIDIARKVGGARLIIRTELPKNANPQEILSSP
ncbi:MAG: biopolymer transporter ExbD, partial [Candidatus Hydrogenedentes bacterium]|nr:biopolymer transporter ExbD [Candidatus Hydrogenedentota bacterium]